MVLVVSDTVASVRAMVMARESASASARIVATAIMDTHLASHIPATTIVRLPLIGHHRSAIDRKFAVNRSATRAPEDATRTVDVCQSVFCMNATSSPQSGDCSYNGGDENGWKWS